MGKVGTTCYNWWKENSCSQKISKSYYNSWSIPPHVGSTQEVAQEAQPQIHNFYLPCVDYTNVRNLDNPRTNVDNRDANVGGDESNYEILIEKNVVKDAMDPIVEGGIEDSSCVEADNIADLLEHPTAPSVADSKGKTDEPSNISINVDNVGSGVDNPEGMDVNVSSTDDTMNDTSKQPSAEDLGKNVAPSVIGTVMEETTSIDVPSADGTHDVTVEREDVTPSVTDTDADVETHEEDGQEKKKSKKRKHKRGDDKGEASEFEKKPSKEERATKKVRRAERKAKKAAEKIVEEQDDVQEITEEQVPVNGRPTASDREKPMGKLKINENRSRVGNKRIPKNIVVVSTENVVLNSEENEAKWKFVSSRRIIDERLLSENTKKNVDIMSILEGAGFMPTVKTVGPYYPQLVREFIFNMTEDIDDPMNPNFQKEIFRNFTFDFSPSLINRYFARANSGDTGYNLQLSEIVNVLTGGVVNTWPDK
ncbi:hypothetical protein LIER_02602 [Lithospermum erythrorhizon]|uniref:Uncharacterized protein n=1 Tax=Lithospermum erythrorhizon TaxID=34254 RepID=A0AAV3NQ35_LITER